MQEVWLKEMLFSGIFAPVSFTKTEQLAVFPFTVAVIVALPFALAVIMPLLTVATLVLEDDQVTVLLSVVLLGL